MVVTRRKAAYIKEIGAEEEEVPVPKPIVTKAAKKKAPVKKEKVAKKAKKQPAEKKELTPRQAKWKSWTTRWLSAIVLMSFFALVIYWGHFALSVTVFAIQILIFRETVELRAKKELDKQVKGFNLLNWLFFVVASYYIYGKLFFSRLPIPANWMCIVDYHVFICYSLYMIVFVLFVMSLKKGLYKYQMTAFVWTHMTIFAVVLQSSFAVHNIYSGLIWLILPIILVTVNDGLAYVTGFFMGRTPLLKVSPKKTWEGFIGGMLCTLAVGFTLPLWLSRFQYMICANDGLFKAGIVDCVPDAIYLPQTYAVPPALLKAVALAFKPDTIPEVFAFSLLPMQLHGLYLALFASLIAPFGGFFGSGLKRALDIKDFGHSIPGHGGLTDRMDCQMVMMLFAHLYYSTFVAAPVDVVARTTKAIATVWTDEQKQALLKLIQPTPGE